MSYLVPSWLISREEVRSLRLAAQQFGIHSAYKIKLAERQDDLDINELAPSHLGLETWHTPPCRAGELTEWFATPDLLDKVIIIYKVTQLEFRPKIDKLQIEHGAESHFYELSQLYIYGHEGYFNEPHVITGRLKVSFGTSRTVKAGQKFLLGGFVIVRRLP